MFFFWVSKWDGLKIWASNAKNHCVIFILKQPVYRVEHMTTKNYHSLDLINCNLATCHVGKVYI